MANSTPVDISGPSPRSGLTSSLLPPDLRSHLARLLPEGYPAAYLPGGVIFSQGSPASQIAIITTGVVKITASTANGREALLGLRGAGELVGELGAIDGSMRSATVKALDRVQARLVPAGTFRRFLQTHPDALLAVLGAVITRLRESDRRRLEFADCDVPQRVALLLAELARTHGRELPDHSVRISLPLSQEEIAGATGASREAVAKALRRLRVQGIITTGRRRITITEPDRLIG